METEQIQEEQINPIEVPTEHNPPEFVEVELTKEEIESRKITLMSCKLNNANYERQLKNYEKQLDLQLPKRLFEDMIKELKDNIENRKFMKQDGTMKEATDSEVELMKLTLEDYQDMYDKDEPMQDLRLKIWQQRELSKRPDFAGKQIHLLEKIIKTGKEEMLKQRAINEGRYKEQPPTPYIG